MARFFIDRPVFAWVIAIVIMLAGVISIINLPISQYPPIAPPTVSIQATYPGASAQTLQDTVTQVIEQKMNGLDHLLYMSSSSDSSGSVSITLTFSADANPDIAQVQVQNKLQLATPLLPEEVQRQGISVTKRSANFLKVFAFVSQDGSMDNADIADYVAANLQDSMSRLPGVGEVTLFGSQYGMRIWLDPHKLQSFKLMPSDVLTAIGAQNAQVSAGQIGAAPAQAGQRMNLGIAVQDRLQTPAQFGAIILRTNADGSLIRVRDVARVEIGSESYNTFGRFNGKPSTGIAVKLTTGANALDTATVTTNYIKSMEPFFPQGLVTVEPFDSTPFVRISIHEVITTLGEAIVLVFLVMYLFLQNFRATLIPTIAVPVVLLGTFGVLAAFGYSINTLTLFAVVLAIGLLVDDAIVVVENVERVMAEDKLSPKEATRKSMDQITGALIGIAMVLSAVFVPMAFFGGSVGVIYRQFSVTIVSAMLLSVVVAIVLTPALCATMLKPSDAHTAGHTAGQHGFFGWFNRTFDRATRRYKAGLNSILKRTGRCMCVYLVLLGGLVVLYSTMPTGFLPDEDQGTLFAQVQLPTGSTQEETVKVIEEVERHFLEDEKDSVDNLLSVVGFSFAGNGQNTGMAFIRLKDWNQRKEKHLKAPAVAARAQAAFAKIHNAQVFAFVPPAIMELGNATGFDFQLQDKAGLGHEALVQARNQLLGMAAGNPTLVAVRPNGQEDQPQMRIDIDREKAGALGLSLGDINTALSTIWGSAYADDFLDKGRVKKVYVQGDAPFRMAPEDMEKWFFRNASGAMVPFSSFASAHWEYAPSRLERYNGVPSMEILGQPAAGKSSGEAMAEMESMAGKLPAGIGFSWTGLSYQERMSGSQAPALFALSILVVFLCLAALYESWSVPFAVVLVVPLGVLGALAAADLRSLYNDVYFQVGLLATIGLSAKNAILIVEFAKAMHDGGRDLVPATLEAARLRLRPILMTSLAFLLGILPLAVSSGAGAGGQNAIGTGVMGGTLAATALGIFYIPVFFVVVIRAFAYVGKKFGGASAVNPVLKGLFALLLVGSLSACSMAPNYVPPAMPTPDAWPAVPVPEGMLENPTGEASSEDKTVNGPPLADLAAQISWQHFFTDETLRQLLTLALNNNRDLRVAALNIERARGLYHIQRADLLPSVNATGESANTLLSADLSPTGSQRTTHQQTLGVGISSFELDFFGRVQSLKNEALEKYLGTEEAHKAAQISLVSNVAAAYLSLLADRERLHLASSTLSSQQSSYTMIKKRFEQGVSSELDLRQAQTSVDTARVDIARYTGQVAMDKTALSLLVGSQVTEAMLPPQGLDSLVVAAELPVGLPSQVLLQRPDIVQAEHTLKAANANIGAARANFFPRISLTAFTGTGSDELANLFLGPTGMWSFLPQVSLPLFQGGRNVATLRVSEADKKIAVASYEKAVQTAFQEVSDALIQKTSVSAQLRAQESLTKATSEAYRLSRERYSQGVDSYLTVLDSQRYMYTSQFNLVSVRANQELNRILLYKALGGGWK